MIKAPLKDGTCDCDWRASSRDTVTCGCGEWHCRLYKDQVVHWEGKHWLIVCAFEEAKKRLEK